LYDYSTEKVRSLLKRDSKELRGVEELGETAQNYQPAAGSDEGSRSPFAAVESTESKSPFSGGTTTKKKPAAQSPFASKASGKQSSPFAAKKQSAPGQGEGGSLGSISSQKLMSPFKADARTVDVQGDYEDKDRPWWQPQITLTQVVLALSFSLLVVLMLATFSVVLKSGAIRFNDT